MTRKFALGFVAFIILAFAPLQLNAQDSAQHDAEAQKADSSAKSTQGMRRLTGCILRGDIADDYKFTAKDGTVWKIARTNKQLKIDPYVGHTVTVVGSLTPNPYSEKNEEKAGPIKRELSKNNAGMLDISKVTQKGPPCTQ